MNLLLILVLIEFCIGTAHSKTIFAIKGEVKSFSVILTCQCGNVCQEKISNSDYYEGTVQLTVEINDYAPRTTTFTSNPENETNFEIVVKNDAIGTYRCTYKRHRKTNYSYGDKTHIFESSMEISYIDYILMEPVFIAVNAGDPLSLTCGESGGATTTTKWRDIGNENMKILNEQDNKLTIDNVVADNATKLRCFLTFESTNQTFTRLFTIKVRTNPLQVTNVNITNTGEATVYVSWSPGVPTNTLVDAKPSYYLVKYQSMKNQDQFSMKNISTNYVFINKLAMNEIYQFDITAHLKIAASEKVTKMVYINEVTNISVEMKKKMLLRLITILKNDTNKQIDELLNLTRTV